MRPKVIFFTLFISFLISLTPCKKLKASDVKSKFLLEKYTDNNFFFAGELKFERHFKNGKWWIYVYDGAELVDIYPE